MKFKVTFCDPFKPDIIDMGEIEQDKIIDVFNQIKWAEFLEKMDETNVNEIYYSPSLGIENKFNNNSLEISAIDRTEWYIFYKRPKLVKQFFGLREKFKEKYLTKVHGQTENDVRICLEALIRNDLQFLDEKIKKHKK